jgi:hypothetical protein
VSLGPNVLVSGEPLLSLLTFTLLRFAVLMLQARTAPNKRAKPTAKFKLDFRIPIPFFCRKTFCLKASNYFTSDRAKAQTTDTVFLQFL